MCKSCVGRPDLNLDVIGLKVFPLSLMGEAATWFTSFLISFPNYCIEHESLKEYSIGDRMVIIKRYWIL